MFNAGKPLGLEIQIWELSEKAFKMTLDETDIEARMNRESISRHSCSLPRVGFALAIIRQSLSHGAVSGDTISLTATTLLNSKSC